MALEHGLGEIDQSVSICRVDVGGRLLLVEC
jgi:hypothetical protein